MLQHPWEDAPVFALSEHDTTPTNRFFVCFRVGFFFCPSILCFPLLSFFIQVYIIIYSTLSDCFKMTPTGTACLTMAVLHWLPKTRIAFSPQNPADYGCHLTVSFYNEMGTKCSGGGKLRATYRWFWPQVMRVVEGSSLRLDVVS